MRMVNELESIFTAVEQGIQTIRDFIWGMPLIILLVGVGLYLTIFAKFLQIRKLPLILKKTFCTLFRRGDKRKKGEISPFRAMSTALAGTLGIGNIIGVATAILLGGPGAVFWMWVSGFIGMMTKFSEVVLAVNFREKDASGHYIGGPMYYIVNGLGKGFKPLAVLFSVFCMFASFGIGNMAQINSIASSAHKSFGIPPLAAGLVIAAIVGLVIFGGIRRISAITSVVIPVVSILYLLGSLIIIIVNYQNIFPAFADIFSSAFRPESAAGGAVGFTIAQAVRYGVSRGVFTHEAGMGSAPIAHASADTDSAVEQGFWGAFEVFADTLVICTISALVILTSNVIDGVNMDDALVVSAAFDSVFSFYGDYFITISITLFAFATILGWSYYAERCCAFLFSKGKRPVRIFRAVFIVFIVIGACVKVDVVWNLSDILNGLMAVPNLIALVLLSPIVFRLIREYFNQTNSLGSLSQWVKNKKR